MSRNMQNYYDSEYHNPSRKSALLTDYSLKSRIDFFQQECIQDGFSVLDYGCGTGAILTGLSNIDMTNSIGVDVSADAIEYAKSRFIHHRFLKISIDGALPFPDGSFDAVLSSEVIEHVFDVDSYLNEIHRVLKPNGILGLSCPHHGYLKDLLIVISGKHEKHFHNPYDPHIRFYSARAIRDVLRKNSFELIKKKGICPYYGLSVLSRMMAYKAKAVG